MPAPVQDLLRPSVSESWRRSIPGTVRLPGSRGCSHAFASPDLSRWKSSPAADPQREGQLRREA
eukprot:5440950-Pyramimonas_sp.AAC.1